MGDRTPSAPIGTDVDRVKIEFEINPPGKMHVRDLRWRLAPPGSR